MPRYIRAFVPGGTTYFAPDAGGTLMAEYDPNGVWLDYIWLNGKLVTMVTSNGGVYPVHDDQTGRPIAMTNLGNQSVIWAAQNLPFTTSVTTTTWFNLNIRFPGQYYDSEDEVSYNGNRDYSEVLGRYIESDPIGLAGGINTYAYVAGNPLTNIDPLGLCPTCDCSTYWDRYMDFVSDHAINVGPAAVALAGGLWPKSLAPAGGFRGPLLGSSNPLTSVPRAFGMPGAGSTIVRGGAAAIGLATVAIGFYDATIEVEGFIYAATDGPSNNNSNNSSGQNGSSSNSGSNCGCGH